jgi:hypothetical protein
MGFLPTHVVDYGRSDVVENRTTFAFISTNQKSLLEELDRRQGLVRDRVRGVAQHRKTGLYLFGPPGTAKTHTVHRTLERVSYEPPIYQRGNITPVGLFELIADNPDKVIVLDDQVTIFKSDLALQILLSALEHPTGENRGRVVKYKRMGETIQTEFRGGIIFISNRELHDADLLGAFMSRVDPLRYNPSDAQLGALMLSIASSGWRFGSTLPAIKPDEALMVAEYVIGEMIRLGIRFDLRLFFSKALPDYQQWKDQETECHWRDLVTSAIEQQLVEIRHPNERPSRAERKNDECSIVDEIIREHTTRKEQVRAWKEKTGKSGRAFYRRLADKH